MNKQLTMRASISFAVFVLLIAAFLGGRWSVSSDDQTLLEARLADAKLEIEMRREAVEELRADLEDQDDVEEELVAAEEEIEELEGMIEELEAELLAFEEEEGTAEEANGGGEEGESASDGAAIGGGGSSGEGRPDPGERAVYLTFDDGPTTMTPEILSILDEYDVPASFFVIGQRMEQRPELARETRDRGHGVYSHTYTHDYAIYRSFDAYYEDLALMERAYERVLGEEAPSLVRFPGGSSNHSSIEYSGESFMVELTEDILDRGYDYIDWNVSSGDASAIYDDPDAMFEQIVNQSQGHDVIVPLFHDTPRNEATAEILPDVITYFQEQGYSFYTLDNLEVHEIRQMEENRIMNRDVVR
ncbi:polysaccharide deacetylase family protein [Salisediminibacterium selenitireducens]|uniref:Polysaccharide deacetylase n=1 Tax=Bacillus selenitireducens (strain ATCC 700615 / DSM 15326 / MLS10) TaxID=439292 RepID=D6XWR0_BACIE|nr:polysaccharide deacetylase family protein [Salisediminibacterium selenitireducens]ADH97902.1 polysaccharide deacetylase [[Bacillus] selenitireducens MLS10]